MHFKMRPTGDLAVFQETEWLQQKKQALIDKLQSGVLAGLDALDKARLSVLALLNIGEPLLP